MSLESNANTIASVLILLVMLMTLATMAMGVPGNNTGQILIYWMRQTR